MKTCSRCKEHKPVTEFYKRASAHDGMRSECKDCACAATRAQQHAKPPRAAAKIKCSWLKYRYGLSPGQYTSMMTSQNACCAICGRHQSVLKKALSVDHNHITGRVRGLLCQGCNATLGYIGDSPERAFKLAEYLTRQPPGEALYVPTKRRKQPPLGLA